MAVSPADAAVAVGVGAAAIAGVALALAVAYRRQLRAALLGLEDPRPLAALRVVFAAALLLGALEVVAEARWFFSDEGMFLAEGARERLAGAGAAGYAEGAGFRGLAGAWHYLTAGTATPLHFRDGPAAVYGVAAGLVACVVGLLVGWRTRWCAWGALALLLALLRRNNAFWGGEQVYLVGLFLLAVSRCGAAYSVDNWSRCRRLRGRGLLSEPGGPGDGAGVAPGPRHPQGLAAIYRAVPAWPRVLMIVQLGVLYCANGLAKWGAPWDAGTAAGYALQADAFTRFDTRPLLARLGESGVALATWGVRAWETLFPAVVVGLAIAWWRGARPARPRGARALWWALLACVAATLALAGGLSAETGAAWAAIRGVFGQFEAGVQGRPIAAWLLVGLAVWACGEARGSAWLRRWVFGRRVWLGFGLVFHAALAVLLNLGGFPLATVGLYLACFSGREVAVAVARVRGGPVVAAEDPALPQHHRDGAELPGAVLAGVGAAVLAAAVATELGATSALRWTVIAAAVVLVAVGRRSARANTDEAAGPWAYGPCGRLVLGALCVVHGVATVASQIPERPLLVHVRAVAGALVGRWQRLTGTAQRWAMFAPRPPIINVSLRTEVVDAAGEVHDLRSELHRPEVLGGVQWWPDRNRKVLLNVMQERRELGPWYARGLCRRWALEHAGETPRQVRLTELRAPLALPWEAATGDRVERFAAGVTARPLLTVACPQEPHGQLPPEVRARHGLADGPWPLFKKLPHGEDRWAAVVQRQGPGWPWDEWIALVWLAWWLARWRREDQARHRRAAALRRGEAAGAR